MSHQTPFTAVYGPVESWRYGQSLGIDPIGPVSTCSFNCVYCQLGEIERVSRDRQVFIPTAQIEAELQGFAPWEVDAITLSGSGEPTLALNLGEILTMVKTLTGKPVGVLTNGTLLGEPAVQTELAIADQIALKLDAVAADPLRRINRPIQGTDLKQQWTDWLHFRQQYRGTLAIQTMLLSVWSDADQDRYLELIQTLAPAEVQLNTPTRPKPVTHQLAARGNHTPDTPTYEVKWLKSVTAEVLQQFGDRIHTTTGIPVRYPPTLRHQGS